MCACRSSNIMLLIRLLKQHRYKKAFKEYLLLIYIIFLVRLLSSKTIREETHPGGRFWVYCCQNVIQSQDKVTFVFFVFSFAVPTVSFFWNTSISPFPLLPSISTFSVSSQASSLGPNSFMPMGSGKNDKV